MTITTPHPTHIADLRDPMRVPMRFVTDTTDAVRVIERLADATRIALDTETVARDEHGQLRDLDRDGPGALRVISLAARFADGTEEAYVLDMSTIDPAQLTTPMAPLHAYLWNADFDEGVLARDGMRIAFWWDLMLFDAALNQGAAGFRYYNGLAKAAKRYLGIDVDGKGTVQLSYTESDPLDDDQIRYAAVDAVTTLWLSDVYHQRTHVAGLDETVLLECAARPFRASMERYGFPFDTAGWRTHLAATSEKLQAAGHRLAELTDGGQPDLFSPYITPTWKPGSDVDVKRMLNRFAPDEVAAYTGGGQLGPQDSVDKNVLPQIGGELVAALLEWRGFAKQMSTYGDSFLEYVGADGRVHARYLQCIVATGRLSSSKPNAQNLDPEMKAFMVPANRVFRRDDGTWDLAPRKRVIVQADLGQAELRKLAQVTGDIALREAFERGDDMHVVTASRMFQLDVAALNSDDLTAAITAAGADGAAMLTEAGVALTDIDTVDDEVAAQLRAKLAKLFKASRSKGKVLNFAVVYGLGPAALAMTLSNSGIATTPDEAKTLLRLYLEAFPQVAEWLAKRDATIENLRRNPPACDWEATFRLFRVRKDAAAAQAALRKQHGRYPTTEEISDHLASRDQVASELATELGYAPSADELDVELANRAAAIDWALSYDDTVVLLPGGEPFGFESRTTANRRRQFNVRLDSIFDSVIDIIGQSRKPYSVQLRDEWSTALKVHLRDKDGTPFDRKRMRKEFEDKDLKYNFVRFVLDGMARIGQHEPLLTKALGDCIGMMGNAYRNAPIQGGVADAGLLGYAWLHDRLAVFDDAWPVLAVHDSVFVECYVEDALAVAEVTSSTMRDALAHYTPDVPAIADVEICASCSTDDEISRAELEAAFGSPATAAAA